jgi:hypothetical protein
MYEMFSASNLTFAEQKRQKRAACVTACECDGWECTETVSGKRRRKRRCIDVKRELFQLFTSVPITAGLYFSLSKGCKASPTAVPWALKDERKGMREEAVFTYQNGLALGALGAELEKLLVVNVAEQLLVVVPAEPDEHDACIHRP